MTASLHIFSSSFFTVMQSFDAACSELLTASLNKQQVQIQSDSVYQFYIVQICIF